MALSEPKIQGLRGFSICGLTSLAILAHADGSLARELAAEHGAGLSQVEAEETVVVQMPTYDIEVGRWFTLIVIQVCACFVGTRPDASNTIIRDENDPIPIFLDVDGVLHYHDFSQHNLELC